MTSWPYILGCPIWGQKSWRGRFFRQRPGPGEVLREYAQVFNGVEGNTSFYGIPRAETVARWLEAVPPSFRFSFKFPKRISHELMLSGATQETRVFFETLSPLAERLGVFFLQLPPTFSPQQLPLLAAYLETLPADFHYAVEVRHPAFYLGEGEKRLASALWRFGMDQVIFDTRVLHRATDDDPEVLEAQRRKPNLPVKPLALGDHPFLRLMVMDDWQESALCVQSWAKVVAAWIREGKNPYVYLHTPGDFEAPMMARRFHEALGELLPQLPALAPWPIDEPEVGAQMRMF